VDLELHAQHDQTKRVVVKKLCIQALTLLIDVTNLNSQQRVHNWLQLVVSSLQLVANEITPLTKYVALFAASNY